MQIALSCRIVSGYIKFRVIKENEPRPLEACLLYTLVQAWLIPSVLVSMEPIESYSSQSNHTSSSSIKNCRYW